MAQRMAWKKLPEIYVAIGDPALKEQTAAWGVSETEGEAVTWAELQTCVGRLSVGSSQ